MSSAPSARSYPSPTEGGRADVYAIIQRRAACFFFFFLFWRTGIAVSLAGDWSPSRLGGVFAARFHSWPALCNTQPSVSYSNLMRGRSDLWWLRLILQWAPWMPDRVGGEGFGGGFNMNVLHSQTTLPKRATVRWPSLRAFQLVSRGRLLVLEVKPSEPPKPI